MNKKSIAAIFLSVALLAGVAFAFSPRDVVEAVRSGVTSVGPAFPRHEQVTCSTQTGGVEIKPAGDFNLISYECKSAGSVFVGSTTGSGAALTAANGVSFVNGDRFGANVSRPERCITSAGTVVLSCRFLVSSW